MMGHSMRGRPGAGRAGITCPAPAESGFDYLSGRVKRPGVLSLSSGGTRPVTVTRWGRRHAVRRTARYGAAALRQSDPGIPRPAPPRRNFSEAKFLRVTGGTRRVQYEL
eukprot:553532-Hanusia_phi.AAC.3